MSERVVPTPAFHDEPWSPTTRLTDLVEQASVAQVLNTPETPHGAPDVHALLVLNPDRLSPQMRCVAELAHARIPACLTTEDQQFYYLTLVFLARTYTSPSAALLAARCLQHGVSYGRLLRMAEGFLHTALSRAPTDPLPAPPQWPSLLPLLCHEDGTLVTQSIGPTPPSLEHLL